MLSRPAGNLANTNAAPCTGISYLVAKKKIIQIWNSNQVQAEFIHVLKPQKIGPPEPDVSGASDQYAGPQDFEALKRVSWLSTIQGSERCDWANVFCNPLEVAAFLHRMGSIRSHPLTIASPTNCIHYYRNMICSPPMDYAVSVRIPFSKQGYRPFEWGKGNEKNRMFSRLVRAAN